MRGPAGEATASSAVVHGTSIAMSYVRSPRTLFVLCALMLPGLAAVHGQMPVVEHWSSADGAMAILAPEGSTVQRDFVERLLEVVSENSEIRGVPMRASRLRLILATDLPESIDGAAQPSADAIAIPIPRAVGWSVDRLTRIYRHERAHIELDELLSGRQPPRWVTEGLPKWAEGPLGCSQEAQLRLDVMVRVREGRPLPGLAEAVPRTQLSYVYYSTIFDYLSIRMAVDVSSGEWSSTLAREGVTASLPDGGRDFEAGWHTFVLEAYGPPAVPPPSCAPLPTTGRFDQRLQS